MDPNHANLGLEGLEVGRNPRDQPAATDRNEDGIDRPGVLAEKLHRNGALPGDHVGIIEGMDELEAILLHDSSSLDLCVAV